MEAIKYILLFTLQFLHCYICLAQANRDNTINEYQAIHWGIEDGLSQGEAYQMLKDVNGFLWISTKGGLNRFDGNSFKRYFHDPNNKRTIPSDYTIGGLTEDSLHNIWIGTDKGLCRYDIKADSFTNFLPDLNIQKPFYAYSPFSATKNEIFCIENESIITAYNIRSLTKRTLADLGDYAEKFAGPGAHYSAFDEASNSVWMYLADTGEANFGLLQVSLTHGGKHFFTWDCFKEIKDHSHVSETMCYDKNRNCIWINSPDGLIQFTMKDKKFHHSEALDKIEQVKGYARFVGIDKDTQGRIWYAAFPKGIIIYDPADQSVKMPFANDTALQKNVSYRNACIYCDRDGIIWSGTWMRDGIYQMYPFSEVVKQYTADPSNPHALNNHWVEKIVKADHDMLWVGTNDGLNIFNIGTDLFEVLREKDLPGIRGNLIIPEAIDTIAQKAWLHADGFFEMDMVTRKCRLVIFKDSENRLIQSPHLKYQTAYKNGCMLRVLWQSQNLIFVVNSDSNIARQILSIPGDKDYDLPTLGEGDSLLFLTKNLSFCNRNGKWIRIATPMDSVDRHRILFNKVDKTYWVVAFQQLIHYSRDFRIIHRFTVTDGLPEIPILTLILDNKNNLWFNTDRAIYQLNTTSGTINRLTEKDGFRPRNFSTQNPPAKDDDGNLYFQSGYFGDGFDRISPDKFMSPSPPSSVYLQSLQINEKPFPLSTGVNNLQELLLRYFQNKITIETGIIDYYSKGKSRIRYKLKVNGKTANWQYAPDYYTIRYENLPPGNYKLVLQAGNAANEFNGPEKVLLIHISPAFWNTWWFRTIAVLCIIALPYGIVRYRLRQKFLQQLEQSEKEKQMAELRQKTAELQQQKTELEMQALRAQMNPHFIFNSLNSINRFILKKQSSEATEYLTKFSKLIRMTLNSSANASVSLAEDLEALLLYLELESLRFDNKFSYRIECNPDVDADFIHVPPMLLQPFVENAIWHGLMNKEGEGYLWININREESTLICTITDDGIGRQRAAELKSKSGKHKSMGMSITESRIAMLQRMNENKPVEIRDLVDADGNAAGTEVIIKIPVVYD